MPNRALKEYKPTVLRTRILSKVKELPNGCWEWQGATRAGYPAMEVGKKRNRRQIYVRRMVYTLYIGKAPKSMRVIDSCGDVLCCNPAHLALSKGGGGFQQRGVTRGEEHWQSKLTAADVRNVRIRRKAGESYKVIAESLDVSPDCISAVCRRLTWRHIP